MAQASTGKITITKMVPQEVDIPTVDLKLTQKEAEYLLFLLGCVGGSPDRTPRKHGSNISNVLLAVGVQESRDYGSFSLEKEHNCIYFKDPSSHKYGNWDDTNNG
jgi:hypothetical protein